MRRKICMLLAALVLCAALPAQAAAGPAVKILGTDGTVTAALRTTGQTRELVYTTDGVSWQPCTVEGDAAQLQNVAYGDCDYGSFYATSFAAALTNTVLYRSDDGIHWRLAGPEENWRFDSSSERPCCQCGPYHFRLDGNRLLYSGGMTVSELPAVAADAAKRGLDYAEVRAYPVGEETIAVEVYDRWDGDGRNKLTLAYTRDSLDWVQGADWDKGGWADAIYQLTSSGLAMIARRIYGGYERLEEEFCYSYDGRVWYPLGEGYPGYGSEMAALDHYNGKTFILEADYGGGVYYAEDPAQWRQVPPSDRFPFGWYYSNYTFLWTGSEYISCQSVFERVGHFEAPSGWTDPYHTSVSFFDADFQELSHHDLGEWVQSVGYVDGVYYARTGEWDGPFTVWSSANKTDWVRTDLADIPQALPEGVRRLGEWDTWAAPYVFRVSGDDLLVSRDGVAFARLGPAPKPAAGRLDRPTRTVQAAVGRDGVLLLGEGVYSYGDKARNGGYCNFTREAVEEALSGATPELGRVMALVEAETAGGGVRVHRAREIVDGVEGPDLLQSSADGGLTWNRATDGAGDPVDGVLVPYNGRSFLVVDPEDQSSGWYSEDGLSWARLPEGWLDRRDGAEAFQLRWTGREYMLCRNGTAVLFLDGQFREVGRYDFGVQVRQVGYGGGRYYVALDDGQGTVYESADKETWTVSQWYRGDLSDRLTRGEVEP